MRTAVLTGTVGFLRLHFRLTLHGNVLHVASALEHAMQQVPHLNPEAAYPDISG